MRKMISNIHIYFCLNAEKMSEQLLCHSIFFSTKMLKFFFPLYLSEKHLKELINEMKRERRQWWYK